MPKNVPIAIARKLIAMLKTKPLRISGDHLSRVASTDGWPAAAWACAMPMLAMKPIMRMTPCTREGSNRHASGRALKRPSAARLSTGRSVVIANGLRITETRHAHRVFPLVHEPHENADQAHVANQQHIHHFRHVHGVRPDLVRDIEHFRHGYRIRNARRLDQ